MRHIFPLALLLASLQLYAAPPQYTFTSIEEIVEPACVAATKSGPAIICLHMDEEMSTMAYNVLYVDLARAKTRSVKLVYEGDNDSGLPAPVQNPSGLKALNSTLRAKSYFKTREVWTTKSPGSLTLPGGATIQKTRGAVQLRVDGKVIKTLPLTPKGGNKKVSVKAYHTGDYVAFLRWDYTPDTNGSLATVQVARLPKPAAAAPGRKYPAASRKAFLDSCTKSAPGPMCECMLVGIEGKYTFQQFAAIEQQLAKGVRDQAFFAFMKTVGAKCAKR